MIAFWIIGVIIVLLVIGLLFKSQDIVPLFNIIKNNIFYIILIGITVFLAFSMYQLAVSNNLKFNSFDEIMHSGKLYLLWVKSLFSNLGNTVGYVVKQDWVLNNQTIK